MSFDLVQCFLDIFWLISQCEIALHLAGFASAALVGAIAWKLLLPRGDFA